MSLKIILSYCARFFVAFSITVKCTIVIHSIDAFNSDKKTDNVKTKFSPGHRTINKNPIGFSEKIFGSEDRVLRTLKSEENSRGPKKIFASKISPEVGYYKAQKCSGPEHSAGSEDYFGARINGVIKVSGKRTNVRDSEDFCP